MKNILIVVALIFALDFVEASHFRYGTMSFTKNQANPKQVTFKMDLAMRRSYFGAPNTGSNLGAVGNLYVLGSYYSPSWIVTNTDVSNDIIYATATYLITFGGPGTYYAQFQSNARISNLNNNHDGNFYFGATVVLTALEISSQVINNSPVSGLLPIVSVPQNVTPYNFQIVASDPENDALSYRISTTNEVQGTQPTGLACSASGLVTLNSILITGYWSTQQVIIDSHGQDISVDYLLNVVPVSTFCNCGNQAACFGGGCQCGTCVKAAPAIVLDGLLSSASFKSNLVAPPAGSSIFVTTGQTVTVSFVGYDMNLPAATTISMYTSGVSNFVTVAAMVDCNAAHNCQFVGNYAAPKLLQFTAAPPASANGTVSTICVGVISNGNSLSYSQHCINLVISAPTSICGNSIVETNEQCDGGSCCDSACKFSSSATTCRSAAPGGCDVAETCTGSSATCPADGFALSSVTCRVAAPGGCDVAETCTGSSATCPADGFASTSVTCRVANGDCDVAETCDGSSAICPADSFQSSGICRSSNGDCDVPETCDGSSAACPADDFASTSVVCRSAAPGGCDVDETCTGSSAACPADAFASTSVTCRSVNGDCDVAETCDGSSSLCPADSFQSSGICRISNGDCDVPETCDGSSAACPADIFRPSSLTCRSAAPGGCDVAETCTGSSATCPTDSFASTSVVCRSAAAGGCDVAEACTGSSAACPADAFASTSVVCRPVNGSCDVAEKCTGSSAKCPIDALLTTAYCQKASNVCPRVSNTSSDAQSFFCSAATSSTYFLCYTQTANGVVYPTYMNMPCAGGTSCNCAFGVDCSCGGTVNPCTVTGTPVC